MANTKLLFFGTESSGTSDIEMSCYANEQNKIFIQLLDTSADHWHNSQHIVLDKATAIKLHRELKKQISYIEEGMSNE